MVLAVVGLGANLDDPAAQLASAVQALEQVALSQLLKTSSLYRSAPMGGPPGQPDYANAVALLETTLAPLELLEQLQAIEQQHGRVRRERWGARVLDLDLIAMGELCLQHPRLSLPHPGTAQREFVLQPLAEIAPDYLLPGLGTVAACLRRLGKPTLPLWGAG